MRNSLLFIPLLAIAFFINYHYFEFYKNKKLAIFQYVRPDLSKNMYEEVQKQQPYYQIYKTAQESKASGHKVYFMFEKRYDKNLDYTSTYYLNRTRNKPEKEYLSELGVAVNYFFYPTIMPAYNRFDVWLQPVKKGDVIISDFPLGNARLKNLVFSKYEYFALEQRKYDSFYIYEVIN